MGKARPASPPLKINWFHILLCLADGDQHGYAIMQEVLARTDGRVRLWPATLYGSLKRLMDEGLIEESGERTAADADAARRRYYRLSTTGRRALASEIARLEELVKAARAKRRSLKLETSS